MRTKSLVLAVIFALAGQAAWTQDKLLYTGTFTSPYSVDTTATLEIWGFEGDSVQERVNYTFYGTTETEQNALRVDFSSTIQTKWILSPLASPPTVRQVYQNLSGQDVASLPSVALQYTASTTLAGGTTQTVTSGVTIQTDTWTGGEPWGGVSTGVWWADLEYKPNLDAMFSYDSSLPVPVFSNYPRYLPAKRVHLQLVKNSRQKTHLDQITLNESTGKLQTILTSLPGPSASQPSWKSISLWADGVLQPGALTMGTRTTANGVSTEALSWVQTPGVQYQLQVVDLVGNSQSVWYPKRTYRTAKRMHSETGLGGDIVSVSAGDVHSIALTADGSVWAWGDNGWGQLGREAIAGSPTPIRVSDISGIVATASGLYHNLALKNDGTVWSWGSNEFGQLGNDFTSYSRVPGPVFSLSGVIAVAAGAFLSVALKDDGSVWTWGNLPLSSSSATPVPHQVTGLSEVVSIAAGGHHILALKSDGSVWAWGLNGIGQLGNNTNIDSSVPILVSGLTSGVKSISAGISHSFALKLDGTVWAWGNNTSGQLGTGSYISSPTPVQISGLPIVESVHGGAYFSVALQSDGSLWSWGSNEFSQFGTGSVASSSVPIHIAEVSDIALVTTGTFHTVAVTDDGTPLSWGSNWYGELGNGSTTGTSSLPVEVSRVPTTTVEQLPESEQPKIPVATGAGISLALKADGTLWSWGTNTTGQLGYDTYPLGPNMYGQAESLLPDRATGITDGVAVAGGSESSIILRADGSVWTLGEGAGATGQVDGLNSILSVAAGQSGSALAIKSDGSVWEWSVGYPWPATQLTALPPAISGVVTHDFKMVVNQQGQVWAWGDNYFGFFGSSPYIDAASPFLVPGLDGVISLAASVEQVLALRSGGTVWEMRQGSPTPSEFVGLPPIVAVAAVDGYSQGLALAEDGVVWIWDVYEQIPRPVDSLTNVTHLDVHGGLALKADGSVWSLNYNYNPSNQIVVTPTRVSLPSLQYDSTPPVLTVAADSNNPQTAIVTAYDNETDIDETTIRYLVDGVWTAGDRVTLGSNQTVVFEAADLAGNTAQAQFTAPNVDETPPVITAITPSTTAWTTSLVLTPSATDSGISGLDETSWQYSLNEQTSWVAGATVTVTQNGTVWFRVKDHQGNQSESVSYTVTNVDTTAPVISVTAPQYVKGSTWTASSVALSDALSGLDPTEAVYWIDALGTTGFNPSVTSLSVDVASLSEGSHSVSIRIFDQAGNATTQSFPFTVDRTPPSILGTGPSQVATNLWSITGFSVVDTGAGVDSASISYRLDALPSVSISPSTLTVTVDLSASIDGAHVVRVQAEDRAGNPATRDFAFTLDRSVPVVTASVPAFVTANTLVVTNLSISDALAAAGSLTASYWIDSTSSTNFSPLVSSLEIGVGGLAEGNHTLYLRAIDPAGNATTQSFPFALDRAGPVIALPGSWFVRTSSWTVTGLSITDASSGVSPAGASFWVDSGDSIPLNPAVSSFEVDVAALASGSHSLWIRALDLAGNATVQSFAFTVDREAPTLSWGVGAEDSPLWAAGPKTLRVETAEAPSGLTVTATVTPVGASVSTSASGQGYQIVVTPPSSFATPSSVELRVSITDRAGNTSNELTKLVIFDDQVPSVTGLLITEGDRQVSETDYLMGVDDEARLAATDASPLRYRFVLRDQGTPPIEAAWPDWTTDAEFALTIAQNIKTTKYLYAQAIDAAGNLTAVVERVLRIDTQAPGMPTIVSTTHPKAVSLTDAVAWKTAGFRFSLTNSGPAGVAAFEWRLLTGALEPNPETGPPTKAGTTDASVTLEDLADNGQGSYYWLFARARAANGQVGPWQNYPFRIDSSPPLNLTVTSSTHPVPTQWYPSNKIEFRWTQPLEMTGVKTYRYQITNNGTVGSWTDTLANQVTVTSTSASGQVSITVVAEDWAGNTQTSSLAVRYDTSKPVAFGGLTAQVDQESRKATLSWTTAASDDQASLGSGLVIGTLVKRHDGGTTGWVEASRWSYSDAAAPALVFDGLVMDHNYMIVVAVVDQAGNRVETPVLFAVGNAPALPDYTLDYQETWGGWPVYGATTFQGSNNAITAQTGFLTIAGTPLSTDPAQDVLPLTSPQLWEPTPWSLTHPAVAYQWQSAGVAGQGTGLTVVRSGTLTLHQLTVDHPFQSGQTLSFTDVQVGPAPAYDMTSSVLVFDPARNWTTGDGWLWQSVDGLALAASGWRSSLSSSIDLGNAGFSVSAARTPWVPLALDLDSGVKGEANQITQGVVANQDFYLRTGNNLFLVAHALIEGDHLVIVEGYLQAQGLGTLALKLEDLQVNRNGTLAAGPRFRSTLTQSLTTPFGTLSAGASAVSIIGGQVVLTEAVLNQDGTLVTLKQLVLEETGLAVNQGTIDGDFSAEYFGFPVTATGGRWGNGTRILDNATLVLRGFGDASVPLAGFEVTVGTHQIVHSGVASAAASLNTGYGTGSIRASNLTLSSSKVSASLTADLPSAISNQGTTTLDLGVRSLSFSLQSLTAVIGPAPEGHQYPALTTHGYLVTPVTVAVIETGLLLDPAVAVLPEPVFGPAAAVTLTGWTIRADNSVVAPGVATTETPAQLGQWPVTFPALRLGSSQGMEGEPVVTLPPALGSADQILGTTLVASDGSFTMAPVAQTLTVQVYGWTATSSTLTLTQDSYVLGGLSVPLPGVFQTSNLDIGTVEISQEGELETPGNGGSLSFRGINGFRVDGTDVRVDPRGLSMGGVIHLPEALGEASITLPAGSLFLEPDGAVIAQWSSETNPARFTFLGWPMTAAGVTVDRRGMTVHAASITPLGLAAITLPDFTIYSTGELAIEGEALGEGSFTLAGGAVTVSYSGIRFLDDGVHLSAQISLPASWGNHSLDIADLVVSPAGTVSAAASLRDLDFEFTDLGLTAHFDELRLSAEGFRLSGAQFVFTSGTMADKTLAVDAALLGYNGQLDLYGFSFGTFDLWGYQIDLDSLSIDTLGQKLAVTGGVRLSQSLPIPELAGLYLTISSFEIGFDGSVQNFRIIIDEDFSFTVYESWVVTVGGLSINNTTLAISTAQLQLPAGFPVSSLEVTNASLDLATGAWNWGSVNVAGLSYQWNGVTLVLTQLEISQTEGLIFAGTVTLPDTTEDGTPYPEALRGAVLTVTRFQIQPDYQIGTVSASVSGLSGPLLSDQLLLSGGTISFSNAEGSLKLGLGGELELGAAFPPGLAGTRLTIASLVFDAGTGSFEEVQIAATLASPPQPIDLFGAATFVPELIAIGSAENQVFYLNLQGLFRTSSNFPGGLANRDVSVHTFRISSAGAVELDADVILPDNTALMDGMTLHGPDGDPSGARFGVEYDSGGDTLWFRASGRVRLGSGFMAGLDGTYLDIHSLRWSASGVVDELDVGTAWAGSRDFFGLAAIENGAIDISNDSGPWRIGVAGTLVLPTAGLPQGLAGRKLQIGTLIFDTAGTVIDVDVSIAGLEIDLFGVARLTNGSLAFSRYNSQAFRIDVDGSLALPDSMGTGLGGLQVTLTEFAFTTQGDLLALGGGVTGSHSFDLFAGIRATLASLTFSQDGISVAGSVKIPDTLLEGLPSTISLVRLDIGWNGTILALEAGLNRASAQLFGFTLAIEDLRITQSGVTMGRAELTLPPNLGGQKIGVINAGFTTSGSFTGIVEVAQVRQELAGFLLVLQGLSFDVQNRKLVVAVTTLQTPQIGSLGAVIQLNNTTISAQGVQLGGAGFKLPDFDFGGIGFKAIYLNFTSSGSTFEIAGSGIGEIPGLGILAVDMSFTSISSTYPIGLKKAYFQYSMSPGIAIGATGLFLNKIIGGIAYGPPTDVPRDLARAFDQRGPRLALGVGVGSALNTSEVKVLQMDAIFWIDLKNAAWAFNGVATVLNGLASGRLGASYGKGVFYGTFEFDIQFVEGDVEVYVFPYRGNTVMSGEGSLQFKVTKGSIYYKKWRVFGNTYRLYIPGSTLRFGGIEAEFGQFNKGPGVKGMLRLPLLGRVGVFVDRRGMDFKISNYKLIKPEGY